MNSLNQRGVLVLVAALATPLLAQSTLDWPVGEFRPYHLDSKSVANPGRDASVVYQETVRLQDATWLRLYFSKVELEPGSYIRMTSAFDNEVQELDAADIAMWNNASAYFNGDTVYLEMVAGAHTSKNRLVLEKVAGHVVAGGLRACGVTGCGYCGADDRVPSSEEWAGRLLPVGCTGSVYNTDSCLVSAGHCAEGQPNLVISFNVPDSLSNCTLVNPPVADQFPITGRSFVNGGPGDDWSVMTTGTNNLGQTAYERYGALRPISSAVGSPGDTVSVWGFGIDDSPSPTRNQTQQTDTGTISQTYSNAYTFNVDVTGGNSGSALIRNGEIIGVVTHCPCPNVATRTDWPAFEAAQTSFCNAEPPENDACADALEVCPGTYQGTTFAADSDGSTSCGDANDSPSVWYSYTPGSSGTATAETCSANNYDGVISAHTGCPGTSSNEVACDDDGCGTGGGSSTITFSVTGGATYLIRVSGWNGAAGDFTLDITGPACAPACTDPVADAGPDKAVCAGNTVVLDGSASGGSGGLCPGDHSPSWSGPGIVSGGNTFNPTVDAPGTYTLTVSCDACQDTDRVVVTQAAFGDWDGDGNIDLADYAEFEACLTGPGGGLAQPGCACGDWEPDGDVDVADYEQFQVDYDG